MKTSRDLESGPVPAVGAEVCPVLFFFLVVHFPSPLRDGVRRPLGEEQGSVGYRIVRNLRESPSLEQQGTLFGAAGLQTPEAQPMPWETIGKK